MAKPTRYNWASAVSPAPWAPSSTQIANGFGLNSAPTSNLLNWFFKNQTDWDGYIDSELIPDLLAGTNTWTGVNTYSAQIHANAGITAAGPSSFTDTVSVVNDNGISAMTVGNTGANTALSVDGNTGDYALKVGGNVRVMGFDGRTGIESYTTSNTAITGQSSSSGIGVKGVSGSNSGVKGTSTSGTGVEGFSDTGIAASFTSTGNSGVPVLKAETSGEAVVCNLISHGIGTTLYVQNDHGNAPAAARFSNSNTDTSSCAIRSDGRISMRGANTPTSGAGAHVNNMLTPDNIVKAYGRVIWASTGSGSLSGRGLFNAILSLDGGANIKVNFIDSMADTDYTVNAVLKSNWIANGSSTAPRRVAMEWVTTADYFTLSFQDWATDAGINLSDLWQMDISFIVCGRQPT